MPATAVGKRRCVHVLVSASALLLSACSDEKAGEEGELGYTEAILVASFNIRDFGQSKLADDDVVPVLTSIVEHFDVVAIQELVGPTDVVLKSFVSRINDQGYPYRFVSSPKVGNGSAEEQYAFVYHAGRVAYEGDSEVFDDPTGLFTRPPFMARFSTLAGFTFVLVTVHTSPANAEAEIDGLVDVLAFARDRFPEEADFILLGDFNADGSYYDEDCSFSPDAAGFKCALHAPEYEWVVTNDQDTNVAGSEMTYDRIVFDKRYTAEDYAGVFGVFRFDEAFGLDSAMAAEVSDHYPVWAQFLTTADNSD